MKRHVPRAFLCFIGLSLLMLVSSCKEENEYAFQIINNTDYHIDVFGFGDDEFEISGHSRTEVFSRSLVTNCVCPTEPLVSIRVETFSDSADTYQYIYGNVFSPSDLSTCEVNIVTIKLADSIDFPHYVFELEFEP